MRLALSRPARPLWLITLADLSLLLVGFFVFLQATAHKSKQQQDAIEASIREAFGGSSAPAQQLAVAVNRVDGFGAGSADLPHDMGGIASWARDALADPRTRLIVTGYADGGPSDQMSGSGLALAGLRAEAVAAMLAGVPRDRIKVGAALMPGARRVTLVVSYDP
jgi:flagellar motor protein MotB